MVRIFPCVQRKKKLAQLIVPIYELDSEKWAEGKIESRRGNDGKSAILRRETDRGMDEGHRAFFHNTTTVSSTGGAIILLW